MAERTITFRFNGYDAGEAFDWNPSFACNYTLSNSGHTHTVSRVQHFTTNTFRDLAFLAYYGAFNNDFFYEPTWEAQLFSCPVAAPIDQVILYGMRGGFPGTLTIGIREVDENDYPTGEDLTSGTYNANTLSTWPTWTGMTVPITEWIPVRNRTYALVFRCPTSSVVNYFQYGYSLTAVPFAFSDGELEPLRLVSSNSGATWIRDDSGVGWETHIVCRIGYSGTVDLGTISKVEARVLMEADLHSSLVGEAYEIRPVFTGGDGNDHLLAAVVDGTHDDTPWMDITNDTNAPSPWTWSDIEALDADIELVENKSPEQRISEVEFRVTFDDGVTDPVNTSTSLGSYTSGGTAPVISALLDPRWVPVQGSWGVTSSTLYSISEDNLDLLLREAGIANYILEVDVSGALVAFDYFLPDFVFRALDSSNFLYVELLSDTLYLKKMDGGVPSTLASESASLSTGVTYTIKVACYYDTIIVFLDGTQVLIHILTSGDTKYSSYTKVGMMLEKGGSPIDVAQWDNFHLIGM